MTRLRWRFVNGADIPWALRIGARISSTHHAAQRAYRRPASLLGCGQQHGEIREPAVLLNPFCPLSGPLNVAKVVALKATVLVLLTLPIAEQLSMPRSRLSFTPATRKWHLVEKLQREAVIPHPPADISLDGLAVTTPRSVPSGPLVVEVVGMKRRRLSWQRGPPVDSVRS